MNPCPETPTVLHVCRREMLRPLRDQILRLSGFGVDSTLSTDEAMSMFGEKHYDLILIDVEGQSAVEQAESMCSEIKAVKPKQTVAFVCNWQVSLLTDCPDAILRTEFDPEAFVQGVKGLAIGPVKELSRAVGQA